MVSIERLTKYPDVKKKYNYPTANRLESHGRKDVQVQPSHRCPSWRDVLAADQDTSTTDAEEELFRRIVSEALFEKHCLRSTV